MGNCVETDEQLDSILPGPGEIPRRRRRRGVSCRFVWQNFAGEILFHEPPVVQGIQQVILASVMMVPLLGSRAADQLGGCYPS